MPILGDGTCHHIRFFDAVFIHVQTGFDAFPQFAPQFFGVTVFVFGDDGIGEIQNGSCAAVVLLQTDCFYVPVIAFKFQNIAQCGTPKAVDRLIVVTHHADALMMSRYLMHYFKLCLIGILIFVDHHVFKEILILASHLIVSLQELGGIKQDVVKIHGLIQQQRFLIMPVDRDKPFVKGAVFIFCWIDVPGMLQAVFVSADPAQNLV
ncbi:hypothetical protein DSECCO2_536710 [anaerobic digester metagenome]